MGVVFMMQAITSITSEDTLLVPIMILGLFVLSVAVMAFLFGSEVISLYIANKKKEAIDFFLKTVGTFALLLILFIVAGFYISTW